MSEGGDPRYASGSIVSRPTKDGGFEIFLGQAGSPSARSQQASGFPVRTVTGEDSAGAMLRRCRGLSPGEAAQILGAELRPAVALGHWIAAVRALFEDEGVMFFVTESGAATAWADRTAKLGNRRQELLAGKMSFRVLLEAEAMLCDLTRFKYFSHWLEDSSGGAPVHIRYFLGGLSASVEPVVSPPLGGLWVTPERGLAAHGGGQLALSFPAFAALRELANFDSWRSLCAEYGL
jgi:hypothetical protein